MATSSPDTTVVLILNERNEEIVHAGVLKRRSSKDMKEWKDRYFELSRTGQLDVKKFQDSSVSKMALRTSYDSTILPEMGHRSEIFTVQPFGMEVFEFKAQSQLDSQAWVQAFRRIQIDLFQHIRILPDECVPPAIHQNEREKTLGIGAHRRGSDKTHRPAFEQVPSKAGPLLSEVIGNGLVGCKPRNISPMPNVVMGATGQYKNEFGKVISYVVEELGNKWTPIEQRDIKVPKKIMKACIGTVQVLVCSGETGWYEGPEGRAMFYSYDGKQGGWKTHVDPTEGPLQPARSTQKGKPGWYVNPVGHEIYCKLDPIIGWTCASTEDVISAACGLIDNWQCSNCKLSNAGSRTFCEVCLEDEEQQCKICFELLINCTFSPCGHTACCTLCAWRLSTCPLCRCVVDRLVAYPAVPILKSIDTPGGASFNGHCPIDDGEVADLLPRNSGALNSVPLEDCESGQLIDAGNSILSAASPFGISTAASATSLTHRHSGLVSNSTVSAPEATLLESCSSRAVRPHVSRLRASVVERSQRLTPVTRSRIRTPPGESKVDDESSTEEDTLVPGDSACILGGMYY